MARTSATLRSAAVTWRSVWICARTTSMPLIMSTAELTSVDSRFSMATCVATSCAVPPESGSLSTIRGCV